MKNTIDLNGKSIEFLKALAYDLLVQVSDLQKNLGIVNAEIAKKSQPVEPPKDVTETKT